MGNGKKGGGGLTAHQITGGRTLAEVKAMHSKQMAMGERIDQIADYRLQELQKATQQLYVETENFRMNQHAELRREIEVSWDIALRMVPWWKRWDLGRLSVLARQVAETIKEQTIAAYRAAQRDAENRLAAERNEQLAMAEAAKEQAELEGKKEAIGQKPMTQEEAYGLAESPALRPGQQVPATDEYGREQKETINIGELQAGETKTVIVKAERVDDDTIGITTHDTSNPDNVEGVKVEVEVYEEEDESSPVDLDALKA